MVWDIIPTMGIRTQINWGVFGIFGILIVGFIVAGLLVSSDARTDDGHPLNIFFFFMAGMFFLSIAGILVYSTLSNRRRDRRERTWYDARAEILEMGETGTYINNQPKIRFRLHVNSPVHPPCEVVHKQVIPLTALAQFQVGKTIRVKVNPEDPRDIMFI